MLVKNALNLFSIFIFGLSVSHTAMKIINQSFAEKLSGFDKANVEVNPKKPEWQRRQFNTDDFSFLWERGILGAEKKAQEVAVQPEIRQEVLSPLSSTYRLVGTIVGENSRYALIASKSDNKVIVKRIKEEIEPGAIISAIKSDRIEILRGNTIEILFLFQEDEKRFSEARVSPQVSQFSSSPQPSPEPFFGQFGPRTSPEADLKQVGENTYEVRREYVQANLQDMTNLLVSARAIPYIKDGQIQGFRLVNISPGSFYRVIGIQDGDVIKSINGIQLSNPQSLMKIMSDIQNETYFEIKIERMGQDKTLRYYIR